MRRPHAAAMRWTHAETGVPTRAVPCESAATDLEPPSPRPCCRLSRPRAQRIPRRAQGRILAASFVGTAIEFFDFYIYATATALVIGPVFFPSGAPGVQQLSAFATFAIAFIARPVGAALFGHFGDRVGRKATLVASLLIMGLSTVLIGCLPTYATAGWWAPAALCILRCGQGIGFGGEWGGAALLAVENAPPGRRAWYGIFPQLGAPVGFILANLGFLCAQLRPVAPRASRPGAGACRSWPRPRWSASASTSASSSPRRRPSRRRSTQARARAGALRRDGDPARRARS